MSKLELIAIQCVQNGPSISYDGEDDDVGVFTCCGEVSYREHAHDCWFPVMIDELRTLGHKV